jgi:hypothetical protein
MLMFDSEFSLKHFKLLHPFQKVSPFRNPAKQNGSLKKSQMRLRTDRAYLLSAALEFLFFELVAYTSLWHLGAKNCCRLRQNAPSGIS